MRQSRRVVDLLKARGLGIKLAVANRAVELQDQAVQSGVYDGVVLDNVTIHAEIGGHLALYDDLTLEFRLDPGSPIVVGYERLAVHEYLAKLCEKAMRDVTILPIEGLTVVNLDAEVEDLQIVCFEDEKLAIGRHFGSGGCGGSCKCAAEQKPYQAALDVVAGAPPASVLHSPGGLEIREPEEGERCEL